MDYRHLRERIYLSGFRGLELSRGYRLKSLEQRTNERTNERLARTTPLDKVSPIHHICREFTGHGLGRYKTWSHAQSVVPFGEQGKRGDRHPATSTPQNLSRFFCAFFVHAP